jgi:hypothetical protein
MDTDVEMDFVETARDCLHSAAGDLGWRVGAHAALRRQRRFIAGLRASQGEATTRTGREPLVQAAKSQIAAMVKGVVDAGWRRYRVNYEWLDTPTNSRDFCRGQSLGFMYTMSEAVSRAFLGGPLSERIDRERQFDGGLGSANAATLSQCASTMIVAPIKMKTTPTRTAGASGSRNSRYANTATNSG